MFFFKTFPKNREKMIFGKLIFDLKIRELVTNEGSRSGELKF